MIKPNGVCLATTHTVQIMTAAFDEYAEFEMNATCFQVCFRW